jgi:hypothetical protein
MKTIEWEVPKEPELEKRTATIESDNEVFIKEFDGFSHYIGFLGKGEGNRNKIIIRFSPNRYMKFEQMSGDPIVNAERRLKLDRRSEVITKGEFFIAFNTESARYNRISVYDNFSKENKP